MRVAAAMPLKMVLAALWIALAFCPTTAKSISKFEMLVTIQFLDCEEPATQGCEAFSSGEFSSSLDYFMGLAETGDAAGQNNVGVMYEGGAGVSKDDSEALLWYQMAAAQNHALAQYNLAVLIAADHILGTADPNRKEEDFVTAYVWLQRAAQQGLEFAVDGLSDLRPHMTAVQIAEAERRLKKWQSSQ